MRFCTVGFSPSAVVRVLSEVRTLGAVESQLCCSQLGAWAGGDGGQWSFLVSGVHSLRVGKWW